MMSDTDNLDKIVYLLDQLEKRLSSVETDLAEIKPKLERVENFVKIHEQGIWNLSDRMTHESLSILDIIDDMQAKLNPVYDRVLPHMREFSVELRQALERRKRPG